MNNIKENAILLCPNCKKKQTVKMPVDACQYFYVCSQCSVRIKAKPGDCCVFCSYAGTKCPPKQKEELINMSD